MVWGHGMVVWVLDGGWEVGGGPTIINYKRLLLVEQL